jgi:hypothetical protein
VTDDPLPLRRLFVVVFTETDEPVDGAVASVASADGAPLDVFDDADGTCRIGSEFVTAADGSFAGYVEAVEVEVVLRSTCATVLGDWRSESVSFPSTTEIVETDGPEPVTVFVDWPRD